MNKPCPFCGSTNHEVFDGGTFRWRHVECRECGARGPDVSVQTLGKGTPSSWETEAIQRAYAEWNNRPTEQETKK